MYLYLLIIAFVIYLIVYFISYNEKNTLYDNHKYSMLLTVIGSAVAYFFFFSKKVVSASMESTNYSDSAIHLEDMLMDTE